MTSYTPNFNLDLYESTDKPNLRDQYNSAMGKIDTQLNLQDVTISSISNVANAANQTANTAAQNASSAITATQTQATALENESTARSSADTALQNSIDDLEAAFSGSLGTKMIVIGDSFSEDSRVTAPWYTKVANYFGWQVENFALGGAGFIHKGSGNISPTFIEQLDNAHAAGIEDDDIACIIVFGGVNDWFSNRSTSAMQSAILQFEARLLTYYPKALKKTFVAFGNTGYMIANTYAGYMPWYQSIKTYAELNTSLNIVDYVPFWSNYNGMGFFSFNDDTTQPGNDGNAFFAEQFIKCIKGTYTGVSKVLAEFVNTSTSVGTFNGYIYWCNGCLYDSIIITSANIPTGNTAISGQIQPFAFPGPSGQDVRRYLNLVDCSFQYRAYDGRININNMTGAALTGTYLAH